MSGVFANQLRVTDDVVVLGPPATGVARILLRVQMPEVWSAVKIDAAADAAVSELKAAALKALYGDTAQPSEFLLKLNGLEVLDEAQSVASSGAKNGSTFLLTVRLRRPVR
jgi:hypothetical protein